MKRSGSHGSWPPIGVDDRYKPKFTPLGIKGSALFYRDTDGQLVVFNTNSALYRRKALLSLVQGDVEHLLQLVPSARLPDGFSPSEAGRWVMSMAADVGILHDPERHGFKQDRNGRWTVATA
jgi:hypothetical protein